MQFFGKVLEKYICTWGSKPGHLNFKKHDLFPYTLRSEVPSIFLEKSGRGRLPDFFRKIEGTFVRRVV